MHILSIGTQSNLTELKQKFGAAYNYLFGEGININKQITQADVVFDFFADKDLIANGYSNFFKPVFFDTTLITLDAMMENARIPQRDSFFGFCGLPTFVNRPVLEVSMGDLKNEKLLTAICAQLGTDQVCVEDRVGLVTPRVICSVINEAYFALEEGTATRSDIDLAMKLGTNYPYGPFEWAARIGIDHVVELLDVVYQEGHDERYKICALLRSEGRWIKKN